METDSTRQAGSTLDDILLQRNTTAQTTALRQTLLGLSDAAIAISGLLNNGPLSGALGRSIGAANNDGDEQKELDVIAQDIIVDALKETPTAFLASEEEDDILILDRNATLAVAVDPLDGSSNIDTNVSIGTIFSIFQASECGARASLLRPGREQIAAGYFIYGPNTSLVLTTGEGTDLYVLDRSSDAFRLAIAGITIPKDTAEFAINASNYRHWLPPVRNFIDDCLAGVHGPRCKDFNMRWVASLVAETHRILSRGGIFLYPADQRTGYEHGRLRLLYEAFPISMLIAQAGGEATDGECAILELTPETLHQRTPFVFGSSQKVDRVRAYHTNPEYDCEKSPLFNQRGLFRV